mmetsp:Transcript_29426/g.41414  ORF Transcript_29426/g.41414 Transcript_29426/m.41414 type:complete len:286 (+) Transcript_29426:10-867(+)
MESLPEDVLDVIFSVLLQDDWILSMTESSCLYTKLSIVCKQWRKVLTEKQHFHRFHLSRYPRQYFINFAYVAGESDRYTEKLLCICRAFYLQNPSKEELYSLSHSIERFIASEKDSLCKIHEELEKLQDSRKYAICKSYMEQLTPPFEKLCSRISNILHLCLRREQDNELKVEMFRQLARLSAIVGKPPEVVLEYFSQGQQLSLLLKPINYYRLKIAFDYATYCKQDLKLAHEGLQIAEGTFDSALEVLDDETEMDKWTLNPILTMLQILKDTKAIWKEEISKQQ